MFARLSAFVIWSLVAATAIFWVLRLSANPPPVPPNWRPYLDKLPSDPWKSPYQYANPGLKGEIDVYSFGADGKAGGEGEAADIGNWDS